MGAATCFRNEKTVTNHLLPLGLLSYETSLHPLRYNNILSLYCVSQNMYQYLKLQNQLVTKSKIYIVTSDSYIITI